MIRKGIWLAALTAVTMGCSDNGAGTADGLSESDRKLVASLSEIDPLEGREEAAWCSGCHGVDGVGMTERVPHLAGQSSFYLYRQLHAYRHRVRDNPAMGKVAASLVDSAMMETAAYYANLAPPEAIPPLVGMVASGPVELGRSASAGCSGCHGADGNSAMPGMPGLAGHAPADLVAAMHAYQDGSRNHPFMASAMQSLKSADIGNIALFYAVQTPTRLGRPGAGDPVAGERTAAACAACHGVDGNSTDPHTPNLAGEDAQYLITATKAYIDGTRSYLMMTHPVASLSEEDIENLAAFYANQEPKAATVRRPLTIADWAARCDRCHGEAGTSTDLRFPSLSAQSRHYIEVALKAYRSENRRNSMMHAMSLPLSPGEIEGLAAHYASLPRKTEHESHK